MTRKNIKNNLTSKDVLTSMQRPELSDFEIAQSQKRVFNSLSIELNKQKNEMENPIPNQNEGFWTKNRLAFASLLVLVIFIGGIIVATANSKPQKSATDDQNKVAIAQPDSRSDNAKKIGIPTTWYSINDLKFGLRYNLPTNWSFFKKEDNDTLRVTVIQPSVNPNDTKLFLNANTLLDQKCNNCESKVETLEINGTKFNIDYQIPKNNSELIVGKLDGQLNYKLDKTGTKINIYFQIKSLEDLSSIKQILTGIEKFVEVKENAKAAAEITSKPTQKMKIYEDKFVKISYPEDWTAEANYTSVSQYFVRGVTFSKGSYYLDFDYNSMLTTGAGYGFISDGIECGQRFVSIPANAGAFAISVDKNYIATNQYFDTNEARNSKDPNSKIDTACKEIAKLEGTVWGGALVAIDFRQILNGTKNAPSTNAFTRVYYGYKYKHWSPAYTVDKFINDPNLKDTLPQKSDPDLRKNLIEMDNILYSVDFKGLPPGLG